MAKKKDQPNLIKLINTTNFGDWQGFAEELQQGSDRATAILGGVFIDENLQALLTAFLVDEKAVRDDLFGVDKPLSTFSARAKLAYGLGLISRSTLNDIDIVRNIRNAFAHALHGLSFEHERIKELCDQLEPPKQVPFRKPESLPRIAYIFTILTTATYLQLKTEAAKRERRVATTDRFMMRWESHGDVENAEWKDPYIRIEPATLDEEQSDG